MGRLSLAMLGRPELHHAGQAVTLPNRKALALLIYLAVESRMHSREKLATLLWPESDEARGRASLRLMLTYLRDALGDSPHLIIERDSIAFNFDSDFDSDFHALQTAAQTARATPHSLDPTQWPTLQAAVSLYRGDFLEGFSLSDAPEFDDWARLQREVCHRRMSQVFDRLSQWQSEGGELSSAIETATRWAAHDPLNEAAHRRLMQLQLITGDRTAALRAYENYRTILKRELKADPSPETEALADRIQSQEASAPHPSTEAQPARASAQDAASPEAPLIGRVNEHTALVTAFRMVRRGQPHAVVIEGEPGIGKTRLGTEFARWAAAQGATVLQGRAFETSGGLPYQPVVEALRQANLQLPITNLSLTWLAELSRLLPELRDRDPDLPPPLTLDQAEAQARLFEAVARFGQALAERATLVMFIDDLQWADAASLDLLRYVARRWAGADVPVLILLTGRSEDLGALTGWLTGLGRELTLTRLPLRSLTLEDTQRLAQALAVTEVVDASRLFTDTGGHPLFIVETIKSLREEGRPVSIPPGVRAVIHARLNRLSANALTLCAAAAVLGSQFDFDLLCRVARVNEYEGLPALDELLRRDLLRESGARYVFGHDKIREIVYTEAGEARRRVFHRRALEALEAPTRAPAPAAELARHALAGGLTERAFHLSQLAGNEAMRLFAVRDAITHYQQARALATSQTPRFASDLHSLNSQLGRAYELTDQREKAQALYQEMLDLARERHAPDMECAALNRQATLVAQDARNFQQAYDLLRTALTVAEANDDKAGLAETEWNLAQVAHYASHMESSLAHGERALALSRELGDKELTARSLNALALAFDEMGRWAKAQACADEAQALYAELGNRAMMADSLSVLAEAQIRLGQPRAGLTTARAAYAITLEIENAWGQANTAQHIAFASLEIGEYGEALRAAQAGVAAARAAGFNPLVFFNLMILGNIYRSLFALEAGRAAHAEAQEIADDLKHPFMRTWVAAELCADCAVAGAWAEAHTYMKRGLSIRNEVDAYMGLAYWQEMETLVWAGETGLAADEVQRFGERFGDQRRYRIPYLRALAVLARARGEASHTMAHLQEAAALAEAIGLPGELWQLYAALGEKKRAAEIAQSLAATIDDERLRAEFLSAEPVRRVIGEARG